MRHRTIIYISGILIFIISFLILFIIANIASAFSDFIEPGRSSFKSLLFVLITLFLPMVSSFFSSRTFVKWFEKRKNLKVNWIPKNKIILFLIVFLYSLTAFIGIPAVQSQNNNWAVEEYKRINTGDNPRVWESHPYIKSFVSVPIIPFFVMSYHEYQLDGLYGWGGWDIQLWYLVGVKRLLSVPFWVS